MGGGSGSGKAHRWFYILHRASIVVANRFNREVFQEQTFRGTPQASERDKKGQYVDFHSDEFWRRFHEARQKVEEEATVTDVHLPDALQLMFIVSSLLDQQRIMRRVVAIVSNVCASFDNYMRRFVDQSHLPYTLISPMMDIMRAAMVAIPSTLSLIVAVEGTSDVVRIYYSTPPLPSIDASCTITIDLPHSPAL
ncbi:hypothetical protein M9H77_16758 [Catharanthus roseus]|uniref:Uncharacterized protein n=1 Tax=Catharanthus roseus TaxID=4058 RepID=A0ACC0B2M3_CATRO|nr:hypothetical protein M9H77_16758 [Catharanthus roseus]